MDIRREPIFKRNAERLRELASMFWPVELSKEAADISVIPLLLQTQDQFLAVLGIPVPNLANLFTIVDSSSIPGNLFLKHLTVLTDFGGEPLQRLNKSFKSFFPLGQLDYIYDGEQYTYPFEVLPVSSLTNQRLHITGKKLLTKRPLSTLAKDVAAILIFGSACINESTAAHLLKCEIGNYLGQPRSLEKFVKQRYIWVSRQTAGAQSNDLGQLAQKYVVKYLKEHLSLEGNNIYSNGRIPDITHTEEDSGQLTTFDIVVSRNGKYVGIEISFQVTTNSTIERKAREAQAIYHQIEQAGHKIAYVLDGAGNFQRTNALSKLCLYSHCTVAFSPSEFDVLCEFIRGYLG